MSTVRSTSIVAVIEVDVVDRGGIARDIFVRVAAEAPSVDYALPVVGRFTLAGPLAMFGGNFPRGEQRTVEYKGFRGATYTEWPVEDVQERGPLEDGEFLHFESRDLRRLGIYSRSHWDQAEKGSFAHGFPQVVEWDEALAERYDLTRAAPLVAKFKDGVAEHILIENGRPFWRQPLPVWWAHADANELVLEDDIFKTRYRGADLFPLQCRVDADLYLRNVAPQHGRPRREVGSIEYLDPAWELPDPLDMICREAAPWVAKRFARHLSDIPAELVRHYHTASNYHLGSATTTGERTSLLSGLGGLLEASVSLPPTQRGEWSDDAVAAMKVRIHEIEGVPHYFEEAGATSPGC